MSKQNTGDDMDQKLKNQTGFLDGELQAIELILAPESPGTDYNPVTRLTVSIKAGTFEVSTLKKFEAFTSGAIDAYSKLANGQFKAFINGLGARLAVTGTTDADSTLTNGRCKAFFRCEDVSAATLAAVDYLMLVVGPQNMVSVEHQDSDGSFKLVSTIPAIDTLQNGQVKLSLAVDGHRVPAIGHPSFTVSKKEAKQLPWETMWPGQAEEAIARKIVELIAPNADFEVRKSDLDILVTVFLKNEYELSRVTSIAQKCEVFVKL